MNRRRWLRPLTPLYAAALRVKAALAGEPNRLRRPVVSVGSLSAGGAGKTPVVIALAKLLRDAGERVDVLSRGYGRTLRGISPVNAEVEEAATWFGDEPVLIAQAAAVQVWVGKDRVAVGVHAENDAPFDHALAKRRVAPGQQPGPEFVPSKALPVPDVHLLDDGFQHRRLHRDMDIVLVTAEDMADTLLPAGNLREPLRALIRADVVVLRDTETALQAKVWPLLRAGAQIWVVRRRLHFPAPPVSKLRGVFAAGLRPLAFCALARPEDFAASLRTAGCGIVDTLAFRDHHRYTDADVAEVVATAVRLKASGFVTTEKDAVKLNAAMRAVLEAHGPLMVVRLEAEFVDAAAVLQAIRAKLTGGGLVAAR